MTTFIFANNVNTTLAASISASSTSIQLSSTANLPASIPAGKYLAITLNDAATRQVYEIVYATAITGSTLTVIRAQESTVATAWSTGDFVFNGVTAGQMQSLNAPVTSVNARTGAVVINSSDVTTALGYTPFNQAGGAIGGAISVNGSVEAAQTIFSSTSNIVLAPGPGFTGVSGTVYLRPQGGNSLTGQAYLTSTGSLQTNPTSPNPTSGIGSFGFIANGSFGGGLGLIDGTFNWGFYDVSGTLVLGSGTSNGALTPQATLSSSGNFVASGTIQPGSDERVKVNVKPITGALEIVRDHLVGVEYDRIDQDMKHGSGYIAQRVQEGLPHLVSVSPLGDLDDFHSVDYNGSTAYLSAALVELHDLVLQQREEINRLREILGE